MTTNKRWQLFMNLNTGRIFLPRIMLRCLRGTAVTCWLLLYSAGAAVAQDFPSIPTDSSYYYPLPKFLNDSYFYIQAGVALPIGQFGEQPDKSANVLDPFQGNTGTGAGLGYSAEMGVRRAFVVKPTPASRAYPFWGASVGGSYNALDWTSLGGRWTKQKQSAFIQGAGLAQLGIAYKHRASWVVEGYAALVLPFITYYPDNSIKGAASPIDFSLRVKEGSATWAPGVTAGIAWHTRHFRIGAEWFRHASTVSYTYKEQSQSDPETHKAYFDWQTTRLYLGVLF